METTMFEVGVVAQFEAAHRLRGEFGPATRRHEHTYAVEVAVKGPAVRADGTLCDIGLLQQAVEDVGNSLRCRAVDELAGCEALNSTAEVVAQYLFEQIA